MSTTSTKSPTESAERRLARLARLAPRKRSRCYSADLRKRPTCEYDGAPLAAGFLRLADLRELELAALQLELIGTGGTAAQAGILTARVFQADLGALDRVQIGRAHV